jgi:hypothetical protein
MLLRAPDGWPQPVVAVVAMVLLAVLDLGGTFAAKEAVERRSLGFALVGAGLFLAVFYVFISSLEVSELSTVTFGWVVILQVGVVLLDRFRYGVIPSPGTWLAIVILLAAQAYLILAPTAKPAFDIAASPDLPVVRELVTLPPDGSAEGGDQLAEAAQHDAAELADAERADADGSDQERLADGLVS